MPVLTRNSPPEAICFCGMTAIDCLILAPAIPVIPIFVTLPWERWIPWAKLPKAVVGPYALYLFFVAFHFDDNDRYWWLYYGWLAIAGVVVSILAVAEKIKRKQDQPQKTQCC